MADEKLTKRFDALQWQIDELKRDVQELWQDAQRAKSLLLATSSQAGRLEAWLMTLSEMIEDRQQH